MLLRRSAEMGANIARRDSTPNTGATLAFGAPTAQTVWMLKAARAFRLAVGYEPAALANTAVKP